ncbi:MAG TPA: hypothetical protein VFD36_03595, partial [Kofleriaceae bacterium]|nr:hypothetical protein [Kofleriaceae bacterium]
LACGDAPAAMRALDGLLGEAPGWVPGLHTTIAAAATGPLAAAAIDRTLHDHLVTAPHALGRAGATWLIACGRPAEAARLAHRAAALAGERDARPRPIDQALAILEAHAALCAGDDARLRAIIEPLGPTARSELAAQLARRLGEHMRAVFAA